MERELAMPLSMESEVIFKKISSFVSHNVLLYIEKYMNGQENYLKTIGEQLELHSTFQSYTAYSSVPIVNHGILNHEDIVR